MLNMQFFFRLHVHFAKCMSQNCNYANCMSNMQFENELHVHELNFLVMLDGLGKVMVRWAGRARSLFWDLGETMVFIRMGEKGMEVNERDTSAVLRGAFCPQPAHLTVISCTFVVSGGDVVGEV